MPKDVVIFTEIQDNPNTNEDLDILIVATNAVKDFKTYRSLDEVEEDYDDTTAAYAKVAALFNQGNTTLAEKLIRKVNIVGVGTLTGETDEAKAAYLISKIEAVRSAQNDDWYVFLTDQDGDTYTAALSTWADETEPTLAELVAGVEDHRKLYFYQHSNKTPANESPRAVGIYTDDLTKHADAAYLGNVGPFYPTFATWKFKRPQGLAVPDLTAAERDALEEANSNFLTEEYKREYVKNGTCCDGTFIDLRLSADFITQDMRRRSYDVFLNNANVPFTDAGFAMLADAAFKTLNRGVELGIIATDPESGRGLYAVTVPKRNQISDAVAASRAMPPIYWEATIGGAVHSMQVRGALVYRIVA